MEVFVVVVVVYSVRYQIKNRFSSLTSLVCVLCVRLLLETLHMFCFVLSDQLSVYFFYLLSVLKLLFW